MRVACLEKGDSGFKTIGLFSMNPAVFCDNDFIGTDKDKSTELLYRCRSCENFIQVLIFLLCFGSLKSQYLTICKNKHFLNLQLNFI